MNTVHPGGALRAQGEHVSEGRARVSTVEPFDRLHAGGREAERVVRRALAEQAAADPRVGDEEQVAQGLDERPLAVHPLVQRLLGRAPSPA